MIAALEPTVSTRPNPPPNRLELLQKTVSASRLNCWLQCRLKFRFRYVEQIVKPLTPSLHVGGVVHRVLQAWNMARWRKQALRTEDLRQVFDAGWQEQAEPIHWDGEEQSEQHTAWALLERYFLETPIKPNELPEAVEVPMEADLAQHGLPVLVGVLDLVRAGGRIVDFKTASKSPVEAQAAHLHEIQLTCYSVLYRDATGRQESARELHHLIKTKSPKIVVTTLGPMEPAQETRLFRVIESYLKGLAQGDFVPSPGFHCAACEFFAECRRWS
jgi:putative RecB family exonuclease